MTPLFAISDIVLNPVLPWPVVGLVGMLLAAATIWFYFRLGTPISRTQNILLAILRFDGIALLLALLLQPSRLEKIPPPTTERCVLVAVDASRSMRQPDADRVARLDAVRQLLVDSGLVGRDGRPVDARVRLFEFNDDAKPVSGSFLAVAPGGASTRFNKSVTTMLGTLAAAEAASALVLLTDGHDFELVNPVRTGTLAKNRQTPLYAVPFGKQGRVRDISVRITAYQPYCYVKQKARVAASLRLIGCEFEEITLQLLRNGVVAQTRRVNADEFQELPVEFEVEEPAIGQYEYEIRAVPLAGEVDSGNNSAITYLNVIDQQIRVLLLEGSPYWDTTFLQRSLMRNDKFDLDALLKYGNGRIRPLRKREGGEPPRVPVTADEFARYDVIILGRAVDQLLNASQLAALTEFAQNRGGTVIFSRGPAFEGALASNELEPVIWSAATREKLRLQVARDGQGLSPFRTLASEEGGVEALPEVLGARTATDRKTLTATLAEASDRAGGAATPGMVHRRFGSGQVVSVGVDGLWRWGLNPKVQGANTAYDRFWDQMILWLLAARDFVPSKQFSFRPSSANLQLGEKVYFRLAMRTPDATVKSVPLRIFLGDAEAGRTAMTASAGDSLRLTGEFLPEKTGRYRAVAQFPDGTVQESRFIVFNENFEETEVATDVTFLRRLCESSGGRLLVPDELGKLVQELRREKLDLTPKTRLTSLWDRATVFYLIGLVLGAEWYLRRRWGLS